MATSENIESKEILQLQLRNQIAGYISKTMNNRSK